MKSLKVSKLQISSMVKSIIIYYSIFLAVVICLIGVSNGTVGMSGIELSTVIFLFVCGLNSFKEKFLFAKSNNISRKTFISGTLIAILPIALGMSLIDIIINRLSNIFIKNPTFYDMIFGNLRNVNTWFGETNWIQSNSLNTLVGTIMFQFFICILAYIVGLVINMIYYRCNALMKIVISIIPIGLIIIWDRICFNNPEIYKSVMNFKDIIFGLNTGNVIAAISTFLVLFVILSGVTFLLVKNAVVKEK